MRILAIGDIHGCLTAFDTLLSAVQPQRDDWLITLGDYVDRGPESAAVLDRLLEISKAGRLVPLRGNHEQMMLDTYDDHSLLPMWLANGGQATLNSYATDGQPGTLDDVPQAHWDFLLHSCVDWFDTKTHFFVHADAMPELLLPDQPISVLRWQKLIRPRPHRSGKVMVCGHTVQTSGKPLNFGFAVCIDTWVYGDGWLTCLDIGAGQVWQANQNGQLRTSNIAEYYTPLETAE